MFTRNETVNTTVTQGFEDLITYHIVNTSLGAISTLVNTLLLVIFLSYRPFRTRYVLLILLNVGDLINSMAIVLTGLNRIQLYSTAIRTMTLPVRTSVECAIEPWLILKLIGDILIPVSTFWMGVERFVAILFPIFYRFSVDGKAVKYLIVPGISLLFVFLSILVGFYLAFTENHFTSFYCGRKAAFGEGFGTFIYCCNITCNVASTVFATAAYFKALNLSKTQPRMQRQVNVIRYYLLISVLSTLLVSLPNAIALFQLYVEKVIMKEIMKITKTKCIERLQVSDSLSKPAYWMQTINSGIHFFVYLALNKEFRARSFRMFKLVHSEEISLSKKHSPEGCETPLRGSAKTLTARTA
uniref:G_PROTEIN_RECEP_F1_2 domain-containing protein n=1 Tax=Caenorhabditis japonica TaxID=281687 RepID=A0A8R1HS90_CAEJA